MASGGREAFPKCEASAGGLGSLQVQKSKGEPNTRRQPENKTQESGPIPGELGAKALAGFLLGSASSFKKLRFEKGNPAIFRPAGSSLI